MNAHKGEVDEVRMSFGWPFWVYMVPGTLLVLTMAVLSIIGGIVLYGVLLLTILFLSFRLHRRFVVHMDRQCFRTFFVFQGRRDHPLERLTQVVVPKVKGELGPYALGVPFHGRGWKEDGCAFRSGREASSGPRVAHSARKASRSSFLVSRFLVLAQGSRGRTQGHSRGLAGATSRPVA